jgi:hypothetical protein
LVRMIEREWERLRGLGRERMARCSSTWFYRERHGRNHPLTVGDGSQDMASLSVCRSHGRREEEYGDVDPSRVGPACQSDT